MNIKVAANHDAQLNAIGDGDVIEWIPYDRLKDIKQIRRGGFGTIHYAKRIDGKIREWDIKKQQWRRDNRGKEVVLKKFDNFVNLNDVLNEMTIHLKTDNVSSSSIEFYGITQDPESHSYMMVLQYAAENLWELSLKLVNIHGLDIVHQQDLHPGNILSSNFKDSIHISDFGLSKLIEENPNSPEKKNIFGVLPYISPEVLNGEEYTKVADVYSFGIIAYEVVTGFPLYPDVHENMQWLTTKNSIPYSKINFKNDYEVLGCSTEEFSADQESIDTTSTTQTHPQAIYTS
ncbi:hypothetical protein Glove_117g40 [Diversispora epigaea]|uniref:Protein kinase domain-containing protein n=1 Tax=Diversispora epigaea TaxID=1348612 RepID=A0A397J9M1_9GLOM|nr:hypothetical protein Glove_117g40 [Diversispora epigaea]